VRLLIVAGDMHPSAGGPPRVIVGHALELARRGVEVEIVASCSPDQRTEVLDSWPQLVEAGVPVHLFSKSGPRGLGYSMGFCSYIHEHLASFSIVQIHGLWRLDMLFTALKARNLSIPFILTAHGMLDGWSLERSHLKKLVARKLIGVDIMLRSAAGIQFGTEEEAREAAALMLPGKSYVIPNGIDVADFTRNTKESTEELFQVFPDLLSRQPVLLFYSRIHPKKGLDILLKAFARVSTEFPDAGLLIAGIRQDIGYENQIRKACESSKLSKKAFVTTEFIGDRGKVPINAADIFVLTAHEEGFSMAILEAMAYGMPLVISDRCHMGVVEQVGAGLVVSLEQAQIEKGLREILSRSSSDLSAMGAQGRLWVKENCSWERIGEQLCQMYQEVIAAKEIRE
jgi:glycosyltransferase involved in cell wall biosynthesis